MTRQLYDSTNFGDIPLDAAMIGFYVDGIYAVTAAAVRARFPKAVLVPISAVGTNNGIVGDVEPGCMTVAQAMDWVRMRRLAGVDPSIYVNQTYGWTPAKVAFATAGIPQPHWWVANYDGVANIPAGAMAKQYANPTLTGHHYDLSVAVDNWPGIDNLSGDTGGSITARNQARSVILASTSSSLHQFLRGTDNALYHRKFTAGAWGPWASLGGTLTGDTISGGVDASGTLVVTVQGIGGFFDISTKDDGATFSAYSGPHGSGTGLLTLGGGVAAPVSGSTPITGTIAGNITGTVSGTVT